MLKILKIKFRVQKTSRRSPFLGRNLWLTLWRTTFRNILVSLETKLAGGSRPLRCLLFFIYHGPSVLTGMNKMLINVLNYKYSWKYWIVSWMSRSFSFSRIPVHILLSSTQSNPESLISIKKKKKITIKLYPHLKDSLTLCNGSNNAQKSTYVLYIYLPICIIIHKHTHIIGQYTLCDIRTM